MPKAGKIASPTVPLYHQVQCSVDSLEAMHVLLVAHGQPSDPPACSSLEKPTCPHCDSQCGITDAIHGYIGIGIGKEAILQLILSTTIEELKAQHTKCRSIAVSGHPLFLGRTTGSPTGMQENAPVEGACDFAGASLGDRNVPLTLLSQLRRIHQRSRNRYTPTVQSSPLAQWVYSIYAI
jgi:hypothetical protein